MSAEQKIWLSITGRGTVEVTTDIDPKNPLKFTDGVTTLTDAGGRMITVSVKPESGYAVTSVTAQLTTDAGNADTRTDVDASFLDVKKASDNKYTFVMPKDVNVRISVSFESVKKGGELAGIWYIANETNHSNAKISTHWYLVPGKDPQQPHYADAYFHNEYCNKSGKGDYTGDNYGDPGKPFLTTYQTNQDLNSAWVVVYTGNDDNYNIIHAKTGKYVVYEPPYQDAIQRKSMHLESTDNPGENAKFTITGDLSGPNNISPKSVKSGNMYFNPATGVGNRLQYYGPSGDYWHDGMIGLWNASGDKSQWYFEPVTKCPKSDIELTDPSGEVSIYNLPNSIIYYTLTGENPVVPSEGDPAPPTLLYNSNQKPTISETTTIKAIAVKDGLTKSDIATTTIIKVATPTLTYDKGTVIIDCATEGTTIYYTTDNTDPTADSTPYTDAITLTEHSTIVKAIAVKDGCIPSDMETIEAVLKCEKPVIAKVGNTYTITCPYPADADIFYAVGDGELETTYNGAVSFTDSDLPFRVRAIAKKTNHDDSEIGSKYFGLDISGSGTSESPYLIRNVDDFEVFVDWLNEDSEKRGKYFKIEKNNSNLINLSGCSSINNEVVFTGTFDGDMVTLSGLGHSLFNTIGGSATVKNVIVASGDISGNGAIAEVAKGSARIYNCGYLGGTITGTGNVGGLVGEITDNARVINCYSFATVKGGSLRGGIVGNNNVTTASQKGSINTMVMNCMFYGTVDGGGAPVYNGTKISNAGSTGLNNFNYYSYDDFVGTPSPYNCALAAEKIYLERFEFHRNILNSNRELAAWYATGSTGNSGEMAKWVLDKSIAKYPILKKQGYYPSVINYEDAPSSSTISVTVDKGSNNDATIGSCPDRKIYDKDIANHHYNDKTIRLPYYWEVGGTGNYTNNKVMTGWEVTVDGGSKNFTGTFTHNYANRDYSVYNGRVFSQGAYLDIPEGATSVSLTAHWADCVYLSDPAYDITYDTSYDTATSVDDMGTRYGGSKKFNDQTVYTTLSDALSALAPSSGTVYDHAIVLVGNYHQYRKTTAMWTGTGPFTVMSADLNNDSEPDYTFFYQHTQRLSISPVRFDFLNFPGVGLGQKVDGTSNMGAQGIFLPEGWFEVTNTCLVHFVQFEHDVTTKAEAPVILLGGIYDQFVSSNQSGVTGVNKTTYIHLGSNVYFPEFSNGTHGDKSLSTARVPISVTGGEYERFYLSGMYNAEANLDANDKDAECYIDGGYFSEEVAGAGMEKIDGDVTWNIINADITNFYGGGINDAKPIQGDIKVNIKNSRIDQYCGGPKFGNMVSGKKVTTTASDNCVFGKYFGAGYGGTSLYRKRTQNDWTKATYTWSTWAAKYDNEYDLGYSTSNLIGGAGLATSYEYEYLDRSGGDGDAKVGRFYINYATLSLAVTNNVESNLTNCIIKGDFFGGGSLGMVKGNIESTLTGCTVHGSVFGGGYSATPPTVDVWPKYSFSPPSYNGDAGVFNPGEYPDTEAEGMVVRTWTHDTNKCTQSSPFSSDGKWIYTAKDTEHDKDLDKLGQVTGNTKLTIAGDTKVGKILHGIWDKTQNKLIVDTTNEKSSEGGGVFGGGDASAVLGSTQVILKGNAEVDGNVFGGGNEAPVSGSTTVNIQN